MNENDSNTRHGGQEPQAPAKLVAALKELPSRRVFVPPAVDEAVLAAARRHLAGPKRSGFSIFRPWLKWPALATACIVLIGLVYFSARQSRLASNFAREDLNHDGKVDILDAFQLARELQGGTKRAAGLDLNGDGVVDQRDVEIIARHAVRLEKGRS
jgi:Dockerin type I domain